MKRNCWRGLYFAMALLAFSCLLLVGGSRLIAVPDEAASPILPSESWMEASLTCPPPQQSHNMLADREEDGKIRISLQASLEEAGQNLRPIPETDANGNIIRQASYMRAVYQSFALGDGFV
ncbi:MAG: hypothetical protein IKV90_02595 [Clostridia bacterium]|nr:hypothetical protein [Clostridia bacterium]